MEQTLSSIRIITNGEGFTDITPSINNWITEECISTGIINIATKHTSCSLIINENADPNVLNDLQAYLKALVPEESFCYLNNQEEKYTYRHSQEGVDDMPAHIKTALTSSSISLSVKSGKLDLGTWQAIYLWEHRYQEHSREICLHAICDYKTTKKNITEPNNVNLTTRNNEMKLNNQIKRERNHPTNDDEERASSIDLIIGKINYLTKKNH